MPIISPWIFYLINLFGKLSVILGIIAFITAIAAIILFATSIIIADDDEEMYSKGLKIAKQLITVAAISAGVVCFIPSQETMYKMLVANYITYENVETASDAIKDGVDYIFEKLDKEEEE